MTSDLVVLAPDKDIEQALRGIISRREALGIRPIKADYLVHPNRDPGIFHTADQLLLPYANDVDYAIVVFDCAWEGAPTSHPGSLAKHVETRLQGAWPNRACVVAIDPEVEAWVWSSSPNVDRVLDWAGRNPPLREWLRQQGLWPPGMVKPPDPRPPLNVRFVRYAFLLQVRFSASSHRLLALNGAPTQALSQSGTPCRPGFPPYSVQAPGAFPGISLCSTPCRLQVSAESGGGVARGDV
jgi:hypothetical protein